MFCTPDFDGLAALLCSGDVFETALKITRPLHGTIFSLGDWAWQVHCFVGRLLESLHFILDMIQQAIS